MNCETCGVDVDHREPGTLIIYKPGQGRGAYCQAHAQRRPRRVVGRATGRGWAFVHECDRRIEAARQQQRRGTLFSWEAQRIRAGDYSPLIRELEPEMTEGQTLVVAWEHSRPQIVDRDSGEVSNTPARPALWITIRSKVRRARGGWAIRFDVHETRDRTEFMRRVPPAHGRDDASDEQASRLSSYTSDARAAVEAVPVVPHEDLERFAAEARVASALQDGESVERKLEAIRQMPARERMAALHRLASDRGVDVRDDVKAFERRVMRRLKAA